MEWADLLLVKFLVPLAWPIVVVFFLITFRKNIVEWLSKRNVSVKTAGMKILISEVEKSHQLSISERKELEGLSANEIWALETFAENSEMRVISKLPPALKVMGRTLLDVRVVKRNNDVLELTELGKDLLKRAKEIL